MLESSPLLCSFCLYYSRHTVKTLASHHDTIVFPGTGASTYKDPPLACMCVYLPGVCSQTIWMYSFFLATIIYPMQHVLGHGDACYQQ